MRKRIEMLSEIVQSFTTTGWSDDRKSDVSINVAYSGGEKADNDN
ncbi:MULTISPECIES: hypothetical protein [Cohnella]|nr:hypothetical protein [Cohnella phaseoli]